MRCVFGIGVALAIVTVALGDTITLRNGQVVTGTYLGGSARQVRIDLGDQVQTFDVSDIVRIEFSTPAPQPPPPPPAHETAAPQPPPAAGVSLPAGTNFVIRMIDAVDSQTAHNGQTFAASLDTPVQDPDGNVIIPRGADVVVKLVDSKQSGKIAGRTELALALSQVRVNGRFVDINTQTISQKSSDRAGRSAGTIGGGAIGGAILGGILGGGKGAAVGAAAGGAGGTAVELATSGQRVRVPSETRLTFVLDNPVKF
jgi:outer membrane lipoprotein SlyB